MSTREEVLGNESHWQVQICLPNMLVRNLVAYRFLCFAGDFRGNSSGGSECACTTIICNNCGYCLGCSCRCHTCFEVRCRWHNRRHAEELLRRVQNVAERGRVLDPDDRYLDIPNFAEERFAAAKRNC